MNTEVLIDKRQARRAFERAARTYDEAAVLQREVNHHLLERLEYINHKPGRILDVGAGTGYATRALKKTYPTANLIALDIAFPMLSVARSRASLLTRFRKTMQFINAEAEKLPLSDNSVDMVYSNLTMQWVNDLDLALREFARVLKPGGMLLFSTFGPGTLIELRESWRAVDQFSHVNPFIDMHDIGDAMLRARLAEPVMDVENFSLTYKKVIDLMRDLKAIGAHNVTSSRQKGLTGKSHFKNFQQHYETFRSNGVLPASYEVVYGHAWKGIQPQTGTGQVSVSIDNLLKKD
jgi:malonyl-CoA O-methyltransferase